MRVLIFILLTIMCCYKAQATDGIVIIGDSLSSSPGSWPRRLMKKNPDLGVRLIAQGGRTIAGFSLPKDIKANLGYDTAIYFLGTGDSRSTQYNPMIWGFITQISQLQQGGFRVIVITPPPLDALPVDGVRFILGLLCHAMELECHEPPWDNRQTIDGIHPNDTLSESTADFIQGLL